MKKFRWEIALYAAAGALALAVILYGWTKVSAWFSSLWEKTKDIASTASSEVKQAATPAGQAAIAAHTASASPILTAPAAAWAAGEAAGQYLYDTVTGSNTEGAVAGAKLGTQAGSIAAELTGATPYSDDQPIYTIDNPPAYVTGDFASGIN